MQRTVDDLAIEDADGRCYRPPYSDAPGAVKLCFDARLRRDVRWHDRSGSWWRRWAIGREAERDGAAVELAEAFPHGEQAVVGGRRVPHEGVDERLRAVGVERSGARAAGAVGQAYSERVELHRWVHDAP
jgi:hypothetical protein